MIPSTAFTRSAAMDSLAEVLQRSGRAYPANSNIDAGPQAETTTTELSPYLRRRLLLE